MKSVVSMSSMSDTEADGGGQEVEEPTAEKKEIMTCLKNQQPIFDTLSILALLYTSVMTPYQG